MAAVRPPIPSAPTAVPLQAATGAAEAIDQDSPQPVKRARTQPPRGGAAIASTSAELARGAMAHYAQRDGAEGGSALQAKLARIRGASTLRKGKIAVRASECGGLGVFATERIAKGEYVTDYGGFVLATDDARRSASRDPATGSHTRLSSDCSGTVRDGREWASWFARPTADEHAAHVRLPPLQRPNVPLGHFTVPGLTDAESMLRSSIVTFPSPFHVRGCVYVYVLVLMLSSWLLQTTTFDVSSKMVRAWATS